MLSVVSAVAYPELPDQQGVSVCVPGAYVTGIDTDGDGTADVTVDAAGADAVNGALVIDNKRIRPGLRLDREPGLSPLPVLPPCAQNSKENRWIFCTKLPLHFWRNFPIIKLQRVALLRNSSCVAGLHVIFFEREAKP